MSNLNDGPSYTPIPATIAGRTFGNPAGRPIWSAYVRDCLREQGYDPHQVDKLFIGGLSNQYDDWWDRPDEFVATVRSSHFTGGAVAEQAAKRLAVTTPLWRLSRPNRRAALGPFVGLHVKVERWFNRVASAGDQTYHGTVVAIAVTTTGGNSDLLILRSDEGIVWAISTAQIAYIEQTARASGGGF